MILITYVCLCGCMSVCMYIVVSSYKYYELAHGCRYVCMVWLSHILEYISTG